VVRIQGVRSIKDISGQARLGKRKKKNNRSCKTYLQEKKPKHTVRNAKSPSASFERAL